MDFIHNNFQLIAHEPNDQNSIPSEALSDIMLDRDGNIWITTAEGIARWNNNSENFQLLPYANYIPASILPTPRDKFDIDAIMENDDDVWMSVSTAGLFVASKNNNSLCRHVQIDSGNRISAMNQLINHILKDKDGNIWLSTQEGYATYDPQRDCLVPHFLNRQDVSGNPFYQVMMMFQDNEGTIWIASKKGLGKLIPPSKNIDWISLPAAHKTGIPFFIGKILAQNDSLLWLITEGGLFSFNKKTEHFVRFASDNLGKEWSAFDDCVDALFISDTVMMITSQFNGLIKFNLQTKSFKTYSTNDGLSSNNLRNLFADNFGGLWITTLNGLSRLDLRTETFSRYDYTNGIKNPVFDNTASFYPEKDGNVLLLDGA